MRFWVIALLACASAGTAFSQGMAPVGDIARQAVEKSKLTLPGSTPFHLKAKIVETTNPDSDYKAEVEEYWVSPEKWTRIIQSPGFSQTLIVNGDNISEKNTGDYLPWWLNNLVTALVDPLPMLEDLKKVNSQLPKLNGSEKSQACARMQSRVGIPPVQNSAFYVFCFEGGGLLQSVVTPGYEADFKDYESFKGKRVARRLVTDPEPGTEIEARITELSELKQPDESLFQVPSPTAPAERIKSVPVSAASALSLSLITPDIQWPTVRSGKTAGVLSMYISVDRSGHVRETWPLNSDNAGLDDLAREQVMKWTFRPAKMNGAPVQMETVLTFAFNTTVADAVQVLTDDQVRKLATNTVEPKFPKGSAPSGTEVKIRVGVNPDGKMNGVDNTYGVPNPLFMAAYSAVKQWHFQPYLRNGKPDVFSADIVFRVP